MSLWKSHNRLEETKIANTGRSDCIARKRKKVNNQNFKIENTYFGATGIYLKFTKNDNEVSNRIKFHATESALAR